MQICIGVNKMVCDIAGYQQSRYREIANEVKSMVMVVKVGWKMVFIEKYTPGWPISRWIGVYLLQVLSYMVWWYGMGVEVSKGTVLVGTLSEVLDTVFRIPEHYTRVVFASSWSTRWTPRSAMRWSSKPRSGILASPSRSRLAFPLSALCVAADRRAASRSRYRRPPQQLSQQQPQQQQPQHL